MQSFASPFFVTLAKALTNGPEYEADKLRIAERIDKTLFRISFMHQEDKWAPFIVICTRTLS